MLPTEEPGNGTQTGSVPSALAVYIHQLALFGHPPPCPCATNATLEPSGDHVIDFRAPRCWKMATRHTDGSNGLPHTQTVV